MKDGGGKFLRTDLLDFGGHGWVRSRARARRHRESKLSACGSLNRCREDNQLRSAQPSFHRTRALLLLLLRPASRMLRGTRARSSEARARRRRAKNKNPRETAERRDETRPARARTLTLARSRAPCEKKLPRPGEQNPWVE